VAENAVSDTGQSADEESSSDTGNGTVVNARLAEGRVQAVLKYHVSARISALDTEGEN
jgi:hypothetical protein